MVTGFEIDNQYIAKETLQNLIFLNRNMSQLAVMLDTLNHRIAGLIEALAQIGISKDNDYNDLDTKQVDGYVREK